MKCKFLRSFSLLFAVLLPAAHAEPPEAIYGTYVHFSQVCGGPGAADGRGSCNLTFEDKFEIGQNISLEPRSPETVYISFGLHHKHSDQCVFNGYGIWSKGTIVFEESESPSRPACKFSASVSKGTVRLLDPGDRCRTAYCVGNIRLHGISFKKKDQKQ